MNIQLTLLTIVVALFMAIWSNDVHVRNTAIPRHSAPQKIETREFRPVTSTQPAIVRPPLPPGITPGQYRVVNHAGDVQMVTLDEYELESGHGPARDFYISQDNEHRWYFIRLNGILSDDPVADRATQTEFPRTVAADSDSDL